MRLDQKIPARVSRILNLFTLGLLLIFFRVWFLSVFQKERQYEESLKPKRRTTIQHIERATIRDRFNTPLAINKIKYNAAVCYDQIRQIPSITWERLDGKRVKKHARLAYIKELSQMLANRFDLDSGEIEDILCAKAALFPHTPFVIKEGIREKEYYELKMLERKWLGVHAMRTSKRFYPYGKTGADVIGYLGAISKREYWNIAEEIKTLKEYTRARDAGELVFLPKGFKTPLEVRRRLTYLKEKSYTINDLVGKGGIEKTFDEQLHGRCAKLRFEIDTKGNFLRELPGRREAVAGRRAILSLSIELQAFAETLLAGYEFEESKKEEGSYQRPWIRGGAIVAMDPKTGEILALASHPRFDPHDFISKNHEQINQWLENESFIASIWDGMRPLSKELFDHKKKESQIRTSYLSWKTYLHSILDPKAAVFFAAENIDSIQKAIKLQSTANALLILSGQENMRALIDVLYDSSEHQPSRNQTNEQTKYSIRLFLNDHLPQVTPLQEHLNDSLASIPNNDDKLLLLDLCKIAAYKDDFSPDLLKELENLSPSSFLVLRQETKKIKEILKREMRLLFKKNDFYAWRKEHFKAFLEEKRKKEREKKRTARPYLDYLEKEEKAQFNAFWKKYTPIFLSSFIIGSHPEPTLKLKPYITTILQKRKEWLAKKNYRNMSLILSKLPSSLRLPFLSSLRSMEELTFPLWGRYHRIKNENGVQLGKHLAAAFYPHTGFGYGRSFAFRQSTQAGSVFKLITGYEALRQKYEEHKTQNKSLSDINPLTIIDQIQWAPKSVINARIMGYTLDGQPIKRLYKRGLLPRGHANIGKISLPGAIEHSSNIYFSLLAGDHLNHPSDLAKAAHRFGYGEKTGIDLPGEIRGNLPDDLADNRTGLYSFAIGQHSLVATPLQTAVMLSTLANKGYVLKPKIVRLLASVEPRDQKQSLFDLPNFAFRDPLAIIGITFPLFTEAKKPEETPFLHFNDPEIKRTLFLPEEIRLPLLQGMQRAVGGERGTARYPLIRARHKIRDAVKDYSEIHPYLIGKTGTAEFYFKPTIDTETKATIKNDIWFGCIAFPKPVSENGPFDDPELVVVVYLKHGDTGRNAAPMAAQIVKKWREIKKRKDPDRV